MHGGLSTRCLIISLMKNYKKYLVIIMWNINAWTLSIYIYIYIYIYMASIYKLASPGSFAKFITSIV